MPPTIISRKGWNAATTIPGGRSVSPASRRYFVVHWPVMSTRDEKQWCRDIERVHRGQGWAAAPGYNYLVGMSGTIYEGAGRDVRGIHSPVHNIDGWGVCVLQPSTAQGVPTAPISQAAKNSVRALYDWLSSVAGRRLEQWWHGRDYATGCPGPDLIAWVRGGMQAQAPVPEPKQEEDEQLSCFGVAGNGNSHYFLVGPQRKSVWLTHQPASGSGWSGGEAGKQIAGLRKFRDAPDGRTIKFITCGTGSGGTFRLFVTLDDYRTMVTEQPKGKEWSPGLKLFCPKP